MKKIVIIAIMMILLLVIGIVAGLYYYQQQNVKDSNHKESSQLALEENTSIGIIKPINEAVETSSQEIKISPNSMIIEKQYYQGCNHLIETQKDVPSSLINQGEEQLKQAYPNWTIEKLTNTQITIYKETPWYCHQHYILKEHNVVLAIYTFDENGTETWKEDTEIQTKYLTAEDLEKVNEGIKAVGDAQLHSVLEDFE